MMRKFIPMTTAEGEYVQRSKDSLKIQATINAIAAKSSPEVAAVLLRRPVATRPVIQIQPAVARVEAPPAPAVVRRGPAPPPRPSFSRPSMAPKK
jgi:hypothetical protein